MSRYFDRMQKMVVEDFEIESLRNIEKQVRDTVLLLTGDREFPSDERELICGICAVWSYDSIPEYIPNKGRVASTNLKKSALIDELHSAFHTIASKEYKTRFGYITDNPERDLNRRNEHITKNLDHGYIAGR